MIVLDTNIVSEQTKPQPDEAALSWLNAQRQDTLYVSTPTIAELSMGAQLKKLRSGTQRYERYLREFLAEYAARILVFDRIAAEAYGQIVASRGHAGRSMPLLDAMIAAICVSQGATLATRNVRDFDGLDLKLVNPFEAEA